MKKLCNTKADARDDDDVENSEKHVVDGGDVGRGECGGDYVISADGVAVVHGVQMVPFHMNVPAMLGWEKGGSDTGKKITGKRHPCKGAGVIEKEAKNPSGSVVDKTSGTRKVTVGAKGPSTLSSGGIPLLGGMQLLDDANVQKFFFALLQMMLQISPASQNISDAPKREEKVNDNGEKEVEAEEEVDAVDLCTSDDEKIEENKNQKNKIVHVSIKVKK